MTTFKDCTGREWTLQLSMGSVRSVKLACKLDIGEPSKVEIVCVIIASPDMLADVLWQLLKRDAESNGVTQDDFFDAMDGAALEAARTAFSEAYIAWCPESSRVAVREALDKHAQALQQTADAIVERLNSPEFNAELDRKIKEAFKPVAVAV